MNKFEKTLMMWNHGVFRGAQAKLAKALHVSTATVALWATGKRNPSKGYVAMMAKLFNLDEYEVLRLFMPGAYQDPTVSTNVLRETPTDFIYNTDTESLPPQSNSVVLPCLASIPVSFPDYDPADVIEWWTLPRRYTRGAKYLIPYTEGNSSPAASREDLYLIKPETEFLDGKIMLVKVKDKYLVKRVYRENGQIVLYEQDHTKYKSFSVKQIIPVGVVVRKIVDIQ